ncbi:uncharacterized protein LOC129752112 [Uranotaenia lowii]|uniref:uncharacterized protein LOC129752112 n=1 Tax=Uranotaenia lowii TaxID=190385 RepID=UPI00247A52CD|nr:uncharacterized protein LOC129752112 [Uranotaenia lowii]
MEPQKKHADPLPSSTEKPAENPPEPETTFERPDSIHERSADVSTLEHTPEQPVDPPADPDHAVVNCVIVEDQKESDYESCTEFPKVDDDEQDSVNPEPALRRSQQTQAANKELLSGSIDRERVFPKTRLDYWETYAPVAKMESVCTVLALANEQYMIVHRMDVKTAFLNGNFEEVIFMQLPNDEIGKSKVVRLQKSLYGLKQAGRAWNQRFDDEIRKFGFVPLKSDSCVYRSCSEDSHSVRG